MTNSIGYLPATGYWNAVCWSPELKLFVATDSISSVIATSPTGVTWSSPTVPSEAWSGVCWSPELGLFCVVCADSNATYAAMTSRDGVNWTGHAVAAPIKREWQAVCWSPELRLFVAVGAYSSFGLNVMISSDGVNWAAASSIPGGSYTAYSVCWSPEVGRFVAVGGEPGAPGNPTVFTSEDGNTWTTRNSPDATPSWSAVCWSPELRLFCAVAAGDTTTYGAMTSLDGISWTGRTMPQLHDMGHICWSPELRLFVATGSAGTSRVMVSADGATWKAIASATTSLSAICWAPELRRFCALAYSLGYAYLFDVDIELKISAVGNGAVASVFGGTRGCTGSASTAQGWLRISVNGVDRFIPYF